MANQKVVPSQGSQKSYGTYFLYLDSLIIPNSKHLKIISNQIPIWMAWSFKTDQRPTFYWGVGFHGQMADLANLVVTLHNHCNGLGQQILLCSPSSLAFPGGRNTALVCPSVLVGTSKLGNMAVPRNYWYKILSNDNERGWSCPPVIRLPRL